MAYVLIASLALPALETRAAEQALDLDGNPANGAESRVVTRVLQSYPVKIENVIYNNAIGKSFDFDWDGAGPGGFEAFVTAGPSVGTKWEWTTVSQVYSILSPVVFRLDARGIPVVSNSPGGVRPPGETIGGSFVVPGKSVFPTDVTVSSASLTSSLVTFFSPEKTVATCGGTYAPGRFEQTITNQTGGPLIVSVEQPACCPEPQMTICDDGCQFYLTDPNNCGGCGVTCAGDEFCSEGSCEPICPAGQTLCGDTCVDLTSDEANCGACGAACDLLYRCTDGACEPDCPPGQTLCGDMCVDLETDEANCGACGAACDPFYRCTEGACEPDCPPGETLCGDTCFNLQSDPDHCGACDVECANRFVCSLGACESTCAPGLTVCGDACADLQTDEANCGSCGNACPSQYRCTAGACEPDCPAGELLCGDQCVDPLTDHGNCGGCGNTCGADELCNSGSCQPICPGKTLCGDQCVDLQADPLNCGACGNACGANQICSSGSCRTCRPPTPTACNNRCTNTNTDPLNCGACGHTCDFSGCPSSGQGTCSQGQSCVCSPAAATTGDLLLFLPGDATSRESRADRVGRGVEPAPRSTARSRSRLAVSSGSAIEAPVCDVTPVTETIPPGGTFTRCQAGAIAGKEIFTIATITKDGQPFGQGPCSLIVPAPEVEIPPFLPSPIAVFVQDTSGDGLCQPGETCSLTVSVQNIGTAGVLNPIGTLSSPPDEFNPQLIVLTGDTSSYPDFPAYGGGGDCDTPAVVDPKTNTVPFSLTLPPGQDSDVGRVFELKLRGDHNGPTEATMPFVLGIGRVCNPATDIDGETYDGLAGFLAPVNARLMPDGGPVYYSNGSFNKTKTVPLKLQLFCGGQLLVTSGIDPVPSIVAVVHQTLGPQPLTNVNGANNANPNDPAFACTSTQCDFQLRTKDLPLGVYVISVRMPDSRVFRAGFTLRP